MKKLILFLVISSSVFAGEKFEWKIDQSIFEKQSFVPHVENKPFGRYLIMDIKFPPVKNLFKSLDKHLGGKLSKKNARTEAHITTITPPEFDKVLSSVLTIEEINQLALDMKIQEADFTIMCVGKGSFKKDDTYYLVVVSRKLKEIRKRIYDLYKSKGGEPSKFDPELFYPHITIGYTNKDLHLGPHGVKKGLNSCWGKVVK